MFDFDAGKLLIIGVIALIVIGPKELPRVLRQVGQFVARMRRMAGEFQGQFMDAMKEADIQSIRDEVEKINRESRLDTAFDPVRDIQAEMTRAVQAPAEPAAPPTLHPDALAIPGALPGAIGDTAAPTGAHSYDIEVAAHGLSAHDVDALAGGEGGTLAAAGIAPVADDVFSTAAGSETPPGAASEPRRKRKILLPKRRLPRTDRPHDVWDRTAARRSRTIGAHQ